MVGCSREEVNRQLRYLEEDGYISNNYRHFKTSLYLLPDIFRKLPIVKKLSKLLPALLLSFSFLLTQSSKITKKYSNTFSVGTTLSTKRSKKSVNDSSRVGTASKSLKYASSTTTGPLPVRPFGKKRYKKSPLERKLSEGRFLVNEDSQTIRNVIESIVEMRISLYGKSMLTIFPSAAIVAGHKALKDRLNKGKYIARPYGVIYSVCRDFCIEKGIKPNNKFFIALKRKYHFTGKEEVLDSPGAFAVAPSPMSPAEYELQRPKYGPYALIGPSREKVLEIMAKSAERRKKSLIPKSMH